MVTCQKSDKCSQSEHLSARFFSLGLGTSKRTCTARNTQSRSGTRWYKKFFRGAGLESFNLAITISANQPIKGSMLQVIAEQSDCESRLQKDSAQAGAEGMATKANP